MPFLRAALIRKNLQQETERAKAEPTPVIEEQTEPEEEFSPVQIEDLHRIIDARTKEAERSEEKIIAVVPEAGAVIIEAESVQEIPEEENEPAEPESEQEAETESTPEISQQVTAGDVAHEFEIEILPENTEAEASQEATTENAAPENESEQEDSKIEAESESSQEALTETEIITLEPENEQEISQAESESEAGILQDDSNTASADFDENLILDEPEQNETPEIEEAESESTQEDSQPDKPHKDYSGSHLDYDFTSGERYVDKVSTKTEFDKMLDELSAISKELLSWQADKFARDCTGKFQEGEPSMADARKYEAFLGGYITNAAMLLYDKGYKDAAIKQLEQAISILQARKKLEDETSAIKSRVEEQNDLVDLSAILGLFGDG